MALDPELAEMMTQVVKLAPLASVDEYGMQTYGTFVSIPCHYDSRDQLITRAKDGQTSSSSGIAYIPPTLWVNQDCGMQVWDLSVPSGWRTVELLAIDIMYDDTSDPYYYGIFYGERGQMGRGRGV